MAEVERIPTLYQEVAAAKADLPTIRDRIRNGKATTLEIGQVVNRAREARLSLRRALLGLWLDTSNGGPILNVKLEKLEDDAVAIADGYRTWIQSNAERPLEDIVLESLDDNVDATSSEHTWGAIQVLDRWVDFQGGYLYSGYHRDFARLTLSSQRSVSAGFQAWYKQNKAVLTWSRASERFTDRSESSFPRPNVAIQFKEGNHIEAASY